MPTYRLCHKPAMRAAMWTDVHTHTHRRVIGHVRTAQIVGEIHTRSRSTYQGAIRSFSYSYLHVYESRRIPGIQIYLNSDPIRKYPPTGEPGEGGGGGERERGQYIYLSDIV